MNTEAELAGVLGHEIGHVTARHAVRQYTRVASYQIGAGIASIFFPAASRYGDLSDLVFAAINSGYSREYESEADRLAVSYAVKAGYDPRAVSALLHTLELLDRYDHDKPAYTSLFATHPETDKRIDNVERLLTEEERSRAGRLSSGRAEYLQQIDGLVFGEGIAEGVIIGNRFQHPDMRIEVCFPKGWKIENTPDAVVARAPEQGGIIELRVHHLLKRQTIEEAAAAIAEDRDLRKVAGLPRAIHGMAAYVGRYIGRSSSLGLFTAEIGFFLREDSVYYLMGMARAQGFSQALPSLQGAIESFRELTPQEAASIQPCRIRLHAVAPGETLGSIIAGLGRNPEEVKTVALLNAWDPERLPELAPGMLAKVLDNR
jgi:predicted Zn-dependent protease